MSRLNAVVDRQLSRKATAGEVLPRLGEVSELDDGLSISGYIHRQVYDDMLALLDESEGHVDILINSGGGDAIMGAAIYSVIRRYAVKEGNSVAVEVHGLAGSAASIIMAAGDERLMAEGAQVMIHKPYMLTIANSDEMKRLREELIIMEEVMADIYANRFGGERAEWVRVMGREQWYSPESAVQRGVATATIESAADGPQMVASADEPEDEEADEDASDEVDEVVFSPSWDEDEPTDADLAEIEQEQGQEPANDDLF